MSLFSLNKILLNENNNITSNNRIEYVSDVRDCDFVEEGHNFIISYCREFNNANKEFYKNILESCGRYEIINESFSDFFNKIKEIIKKFIEFIKKCFDKFSAKIHGLFKSEKYLVKNRTLLTKFNDSDQFEFKGYNFKHIYTTDVPKITAFEAFVYDAQNNKFNDLKISDITSKISELDKKTDDKSFGGGIDTSSLGDDERDKVYSQKRESELVSYIKDRNTKLNEHLSDFYDEFRGSVIGENRTISSSDYSEELFKVFRDGDNEETTITVDSNYVNDTYTRFSNYKDLITSIKKTKENIETDYKKLQTALERSLTTEKDGDGIFFKFNYTSSGNDYTNTTLQSVGASDTKIQIYSNNVYTSIDTYMKSKATQIKEMSTIHTQAFTAKLAAAKDCYSQDRKVLYKALYKIKGHKEDKN